MPLRTLETSLAPSGRLQLDFFYHHPTGVSFDPADSDYSGNAIAMKHLVGTLVRYKNGGEFEPYLAQSWTVSPDGRHWTFKLKPDLKCENGEAITASGFIESLNDSLSRYSREAHVPIFSSLLGWQYFSERKKIAGIELSSADSISFSFAEAVGSGFLEYLSMSYYGYYCRSNFDKNGKWISQKSIVSSGPYKVDEYSENRISLKLRTDWSLNSNHAPDVVYHSRFNSDEVFKSNRRIVQMNLGWNQEEPEDFRKIWGPPDNIRSVVLDIDGPSGFFRDEISRQILRDKIRGLQKIKDFKSKTASLATSFYPGSSPSLEIAKNFERKPRRPLTILAPEATNDDLRYVTSLLSNALEELNWDYKIVTTSKDSGLSAREFGKRNKYDIRLSNVVAGSTMEPWVVELMFGSDLGVSFPDPSGRAVNLARRYLKSNSNFQINTAGNELSQIVAEDAAVIPIFHGRTSWYFSKDIDVERISGDLILPSFDDLGPAK